MRILHITASPNSESTSRAVGEKLVNEVRAKNPGAVVTTLDVSKLNLPHWSERHIAAAFGPVEARASADVLQKSNELCAQLLNVDVVVVSTPMWNFSIPSSLKAWIDHVVRVDLTFRNEASGPVGLTKNIKQVFVVESSGGIYEAPPMSTLDHAAPYLQIIFGFLGAKEVHTVSASGTVFDRAKAVEQGLQKAVEKVQAVCLTL